MGISEEAAVVLVVGEGARASFENGKARGKRRKGKRGGGGERQNNDHRQGIPLR